MSRWHFLSLFIFTFAVAVTAGFLLTGGQGDLNEGIDAQPAAAAARPSPIAVIPTVPVQIGLHIDLPDVLAARVRSEAQALAAEIGAVLVEAKGDERDAVVVSRPGGDAAVVPAVVDRWVAMASVWSLRARVAFSRDLDFALLLPAEPRRELEQVLGDVTLAPTLQWLPQAEIAAALAADVTAVALLPIDAALEQAGLRTLSIDPAGEPWLEQRVTVRWTGEVQKDFAVRLAERIDVPPPLLTRIVFTGDMMPSRCVYERQRNLGDFTAAYAFVKEYLSAADITVGSLDASISDAGAPFPCEPTFNLLGPPESIDGFVAAGFDVVTLATNHAKDCGSAGFGCSESILDSLSILRGAGIVTVGGGENIAEAHTPAVIERNGVRFAFLGYDDIATIYYGATETIPGTAVLSEENLRRDIAFARTLADVVIVLPQWGIEYTPYPSDRQIYLGRVALEAGATLVIGNHPHVVQGLEPGRGTFIAFALGNFVFDQDWSIETLQGVVLEATFAGDRLLGVAIKPQRIVNMFQPKFVERDEARVILDRMYDASEYVAGR